jgi:ABC-2 type transport system ATP-binding protein
MLPLEIDHVTKRYGRQAVVKDLSFEVRPGRVTGFLGPNGAGKSTTMKVLLDLASADAGHATIGGKRYRDLDDPAGTVGVVLEPNAFHPGRTGRNHLLILAVGADVPRTRVDEMLVLVGLEGAGDRKVGAYSLGMRQRLGLAAALLEDPPVLILDEPGNGLDPQGVRWLRDLLRARAAKGHTVFVSSHLLAEVEHLADDVVVINRGEVVASGAISDLEHAWTLVRTPSMGPMMTALEDAGATVRSREDGALLIQGMPIDEIGDRARDAGIALHELSSQSGSLEELFLAWTSGETIGPVERPKKEVVRV